MPTLLKTKNIEDVAKNHLCLGCGTCAYFCSNEIEMIDVINYGRRPRIRRKIRTEEMSGEVLNVCPGIELTHRFDYKNPDFIKELLNDWGPILEIWEGYAVDPKLRYAASSGGISSALALYCIEKEKMHGVLQTKAVKDKPYLNKAVFNANYADISKCLGSRYAPASPCEGLGLIEEAAGKCVFIGKPCDVEGVFKARSMKPKLDENIGLTISIFCAGTPSTGGTIDMLNKMGVRNLSELKEIRYRGFGWPGKATALLASGEQKELSYEKAWGDILSKHVQWRCRICPDHTGEFADIAVGDAWHRKANGEKQGLSLILVRTKRGLQILHDAAKEGYIKIERSIPQALQDSQLNLLRVKRATWGRIWTCRLFGVPTPRFNNFHLFQIWLKLNFIEKIKSFTGTIKRIFTKKLYKKLILK